MLAPVTRTSLPDAVFDQLLEGIVDGDFPAGTPLPGERQLAQRLGVSRPAVREAISRLAQGGLVRTRQGEGTTVVDYHRGAGPELLPRLLLRPGPHGPELDVTVARSVIEVRLATGPDIARLAARRAHQHHLDDLALAVDDLAEQEDDVARQHTALRWWSTAVDASDNVAYRLLFNRLADAYEPLIDALAVVMATEVRQVDAYRTLTDAITRRQPAIAEAAARDLLTTGTAAVLAVIDDLTTDAPAETPGATP